MCLYALKDVVTKQTAQMEIIMKKKLKNYLNAAQIISQLPAGKVKNAAVDRLFGDDLARLGLPSGAYIFSDSILNGARVRRFVYNSVEGDCDVVVRVTEQKDGDLVFTIMADIQ